MGIGSSKDSKGGKVPPTYGRGPKTDPLGTQKSTPSYTTPTYTEPYKVPETPAALPELPVSAAPAPVPAVSVRVPGQGQGQGLTHPPFGFTDGFNKYEQQVAMAQNAVYAGQASPHEAPLALMPDPEGQFLGYPGRCTILGSIPDCNQPHLPPPKSQYPYGTLPYQTAQSRLANGNPTDIKNVGAYFGAGEPEPVVELTGFGVATGHGTYLPGPRSGGGFGAVGACGGGCGGSGSAF